MARKNDDWTSIGMDMGLLAFDMAAVILLRGLRLAAGGALADREARRMVTEKIIAAQALGLDIATGQLGTDPAALSAGTVRHYQKRVGANRRRLSKRQTGKRS